MVPFFCLFSMLLSLFFGGSQVWASGGPINIFAEKIQPIETVCKAYLCRQNYKIIPIYKYSKNHDWGSISSEVKSELLNVADEQTQIWADTILEGDFVADNTTRLDQVDAVYKNRELLGYRVSYSQKAWDTVNCLYDGLSKAALIGCEEGRIRETSYVSVDFKIYFYSELGGARFISLGKL